MGTKSHGFTLVELMVVLVIIAVLAAIAVPALTRDTSEADFRSFVRRLAQDLHRARIEAISQREDRAIVLAAGPPSSYRLEAVIATPLTRSALEQPVLAPEGVRIAGVLAQAAEPGNSYTPPGALPAEIRFGATSAASVEVGASTGNVTNGPATVFVETADGRRRARIVVYGTTGYARTHFSW
jgi:prepilin-type N-terminal cleavage/methylation domain-containing protein